MSSFIEKRRRACYIGFGGPQARRFAGLPSGGTRWTPMARRKRIYEGKAKVLYEGPEPGTLVQYFKDDATAFNNRKKATISGKGC